MSWAPLGDDAKKMVFKYASKILIANRYTILVYKLGENHSKLLPPPYFQVNDPDIYLILPYQK